MKIVLSYVCVVKDIRGMPDLHKLHGPSSETRKDQMISQGESNAFQSAFPEFPELTEDVPDIAFIN